MILGMAIAAILAVCLLSAYEKHSDTQTIKSTREASTSECERTSSVMTLMLERSREEREASQNAARELVATAGQMAETVQTACREMMREMTSAISLIVSPPPQPASPAQQRYEQMMTDPAWDQMLHPTQSRELDEMRGKPVPGPTPAAGWARSPEPPMWQQANLPPDVPVPIGESGQMVGDWDPN